MKQIDCIVVRDIRARTIVGLHDWERRSVQDVLIDLSVEADLSAAARTDTVQGGLDYGTLVRDVVAYVESVSRHTLEALALDVAGVAAWSPAVRRVSARVAKPSAERLARRIAVVMTRTREELLRPALVCIGSNLRAEENLRACVDKLARVGAVEAWSQVYRSRAADGAEDFLNAAVRLATPLPALEVRRRLKQVESALGRQPGATARDGIALDLDLCALGDLICAEAKLPTSADELRTNAYQAVPLAEVADGLRHPVAGRLFTELAANAAGSSGLSVASIALGE